MSRDKIEITDQLVKNFIRTFSLPIPIAKAEYIDYFVELLDPYYDTKNKWDMYKKYKEQYSYDLDDIVHQTRKKMMRDIEASEGFKKFKSFDLTTLDNAGIQKQNLYIQPNHQKFFISVDFVKANFQSFLYKKFDIFNGARSFDEFVDKYTNIKILKESKILRQVLFGNLDPKRQQSIQKEMLRKVYNIMIETELFKNPIVSLSTDELYVEVDESFVDKTDWLKDVINAYGFNVRVDHFQIVQPFNESSFYKLNTKTGKKDLILVPKTSVAQFIKMLENRDFEDQDLYFINQEGFLSKYIELAYHEKQ